MRISYQYEESKSKLQGGEQHWTVIMEIVSLSQYLTLSRV